MPTNLVQGKNSFLYFFDNDGNFVEYLCSSQFVLTITSDKLGTRTIGDGYWAKFKPSRLSYTLAFTGILKFAEGSDNTAFDMITTQLNLNDRQFQVTYMDDAGNVRSFRGYAMVETSTFTQTPTDLVKGDFNLVGNGTLNFFTGTEPCSTTINTITISNTDSSDGTVDIDYTFTGVVAQVKYSIDGGPFATQVGSSTIIVPTLSVGSHTVEIIPVCPNAFEGHSLTQTFTVARGLTCSLAVTSISISGTGPTIQAVVGYNSDPSTASLKYNINGGSYRNYVGGSLLNPTVFTMTLPIGSYTMNVVPVCSNGVPGTAMSTSFNVTTGALYSTINWSLTGSASGNTLFITKNGIQVVNATAPNSGSFSASATDVINSSLGSSVSGRNGALNIIDTSVGGVIVAHTYSGIATTSASFSPTSGDNYLIEGSADVVPATATGRTSYSSANSSGGGTITAPIGALVTVTVSATGIPGQTYVQEVSLASGLGTVSATNGSNSLTFIMPSPGTISFTGVFTYSDSSGSGSIIIS